MVDTGLITRLDALHEQFHEVWPNGSGTYATAVANAYPDLRDLLELAREMLRDSRRPHYYCEDCWYSCPKAEGGCCNDAQGDDCNCGADKHNARHDAVLVLLDSAFSGGENGSADEHLHPQSNPIAYTDGDGRVTDICCDHCALSWPCPSEIERRPGAVNDRRWA